MSELVTAEEIAERLRVRPETVRGWAREGRIPSLRISHKIIRYDPEAVINTLKERASGTRGDDGR